MRADDRVALVVLSLAAVFAAPVCMAQSHVHPATAGPPVATEHSAMSTHETRHAIVTDAALGATLDAHFAYEPKARSLSVHYTLRNAGTTPLAVFDRGDRQGVLTKRYAMGNVPPPRSSADGNDVTLTHAGQPLPTPPPTVPPAPLAIRLLPGAQSKGAFAFALLDAAPTRVRWCLGVAPVAAAGLTDVQHAEGVEVWRAPFDLVPKQSLLCTPWFDLATQAFLPA